MSLNPSHVINGERNNGNKGLLMPRVKEQL